MPIDERKQDLGPEARKPHTGWRRFLRENWYRDLLIAIAFFFVWQGYAAIQDSRRQAVIISCEQTNERYDKTLIQIRAQSIKILGFQPASIPPGTPLHEAAQIWQGRFNEVLKNPAAKKHPRYQRIAEGSQSTELIIGAIVPYIKDCEKRAKQLVK